MKYVKNKKNTDFMNSLISLKQQLKPLMAGTMLLLAGLNLPAFAATLPLSSHTQRVTAYQGLALVTRKVELPAMSVGTHEILISDLPDSLNPDSLSVSGSGQARMKIHHLQLRPLDAGAVDRALAALQQQIETLRLGLAKVSTRQELNQTHQALAETLRQQLQVRSQDPKNVISAREWQELVKLALSQTQEVLETRQSTAEQKKKLEEQLQILSARLQDMQASTRPRQQASLFVSVETPGTATLLLSYLIGNVGWQPAYEARLDETQQKMHLVYQGDLTQRSGESWDGVQLTLSTVTPMLNQRPPQPQNWVVGQRPLRDDRERGAGQVRMNENVPMDAAAIVDQEVNYAQSEIQQTGISVRFQLPESQNVPSSTQTRRLAMATRDFACQASYRIIPRQSALAFLEVQLKNESGLPLLPGPLRSYLGEEFTGSQPIDLIRPGQTTRLNFGVDQDIKVSWKEVGRDTRNTGVLGDKEEITVNYEAEITNFKPIAVELRVQEPAPVSADENIVIEQLKTDPAPTQVSNDKKLQTWQIKAQPWEKKLIKLTYRVTHPKNQEIYF